MTAALRSWTMRARANERGASLVEYALMVALVAVMCIVAISFVGDNSEQKLFDTSEAIGHSGQGSSTRDLGSDCSLGVCLIWDTNQNPNYTYAWSLPDGTYSTDEQPTFPYSGLGQQFQVWGYKTDTRDGSQTVVRTWCEMKSDATYDCS